MKRILSSALVLSLFSFPVVGLVGCGEENKTKETVSTPGGTTTTETKVKETGSNPPPAPGSPSSTGTSTK